MNHLSELTAIVVNYKTYDFTKRCVESLQTHYPHLNLLLVDNGSADDSTSYIAHLAETFDHINSMLHPNNLYHGPAMDQAIRSCRTRYVFTLDSDCKILNSEFLEEMLALFDTPKVYAVGRLVFMNLYGYEASSTFRKPISYIHPYAMLLDREKYLSLRPFVHHGSPCLFNMKDAARSGFTVRSFKLDNFIRHDGRGTCSRYGYGLGIKTFIASYLHKWGIFA